MTTQTEIERQPEPILARLDRHYSQGFMNATQYVASIEALDIWCKQQTPRILWRATKAA